MQEHQEICQVQGLEILNKANHKNLDQAFCRLTLHAPRIANAARPGQFVMVTCGSSRDPLLRRPFSIHRRTGSESIQLLIRVVGSATRSLATLRPGATLDLLGPLGRGFRYPEDGQAEERSGLVSSLFRDLQAKKERKKPLCLIGGGIGIAPLLFLAEQLMPQRNSTDSKRCVVLLGGRNKDELEPLSSIFSELGCLVENATDDGSLGFHGMVSALLPPHLGQMHKVYCCGPQPMMAAVAAQCKEATVACEVSLEANMACGLGACLGCTVHDSKGGYLHVCKQGPVVMAEEVLWKR